MRCGADDRHALEHLCRYITRPALANARVQTNAAGQVVLKLKTAWRDCTPSLVMSPLEFMQRLAVLIDPAATESANDRFGAVNLGCRIPGLGRFLPAEFPITSPGSRRWKASYSSRATPQITARCAG